MNFKPNYLELLGDGLYFREALDRAKAALGERGQFVHAYEPEEYATMRLFVHADGRSGFAVKPDGDIVSVFSTAGGRLANMLELARKSGGVKLDCFAPLEPVYQRHGFHTVDRVAWADEFAPANWNYAANGRPDVVFLSAA